MISQSSPAGPTRRLAGRWRNTWTKQQFYSFGTGVSSIPAESGTAKPCHSLQALTYQAV
jgi:hypothetical protein